MTRVSKPVGFHVPGVSAVTLNGAGKCRRGTAGCPPRKGLHLPVDIGGGGPGAGAPALAKDELICVHRALMPSLSLAPAGSISGTGKLGRMEVREQALFLTLMPSGGPLTSVWVGGSTLY